MAASATGNRVAAGYGARIADKVYSLCLPNMDNILAHDDDERPQYSIAAFDLDGPQGVGDGSFLPKENDDNEKSSGTTKKRRADIPLRASEVGPLELAPTSRSTSARTGNKKSTRRSSRTSQSAIAKVRPPVVINFLYAEKKAISHLVSRPLHAYLDGYANHLDEPEHKALVERYYGGDNWGVLDDDKRSKEAQGVYLSGHTAKHPLDAGDGLREYLMATVFNLINNVLHNHLASEKRSQLSRSCCR